MRENACEDIAPLSSRTIKTDITPNNNILYRIIKRIFDVSVSLFGLILLFPIMVIVAVLIKLEDGGPIFYVSTRIGTELQPVTIYKFRSMIVNADKKLKDYLPQNDFGKGPRFKMTNDPRITRVGRVIRTMSLDEVPQLWNVLRGDISLVGPRPHSVYEVEKYDDYALQRFIVKSGAVCFSECRSRSTLSFQESIELDIRYLRERGILTDLKIFFMAICTILKLNGTG